jgi:hypothetical protein
LSPKITTSGCSSRALKITVLDSVNVEILCYGLYWILKYKRGGSKLKAKFNWKKRG